MSNTLSGSKVYKKKTHPIQSELGQSFYLPFKIDAPTGLDEQELREYEDLYVEHIMEQPIRFNAGNIIIAEAVVDCVGQEHIYLTVKAVNKEYHEEN